MIISSLLLVGFAILCNAELYIKQDSGITVIEIPRGVQEIGNSDFNESLAINNIDPQDIQFDKADTVKEVMALPLEFFKNLLTYKQLIQIILNDDLKKLLDKKFPQKSHFKGSLRGRVIKKVNFLKERLVDINPTVIGDQAAANAIMKRLPTSVYEFISPLLALTSSEFRPSIKAIARVFGISLAVLKKTTPHSIPAVLAVLRRIRAWLRAGRSVFEISSILLNLIADHPSLDSIIGEKVNLLVVELEESVDALSNRHKAIRDIVIKYNEEAPASTRLFGSGARRGHARPGRSTNAFDSDEAVENDVGHALKFDEWVSSGSASE